jgi:UPF0716 family protein affecting phage T7 exclusion
MAPISSGMTPANDWEPSTVIELIALVLTIPGAIAALVTLWILRAQLRSTVRGQSDSEVLLDGTAFRRSGPRHNARRAVPITVRRRTLTSFIAGVRNLALHTLVNSRPHRSPQPAQNDGNAQVVGWFHQQYLELHGEVASERQQWAEETVRSWDDLDILMTAFPPHR